MPAAARASLRNLLLSVSLRKVFIGAKIILFFDYTKSILSNFVPRSFHFPHFPLWTFRFFVFVVERDKVIINYIIIYIIYILYI